MHPRWADAHQSSSRQILMALAALAVVAATACTAARHESPREAATRLVAQIQRADYEGDRAALRRLYGELAPFADDKEIGTKVLYWRGFALWRRVLNGFNETVERAEQEQDLNQAIREFEQAAAQDPNFVDAKVGTASCLLHLVWLAGDDKARVGELVAKAMPLFKEAREADPENPRLLWILGASSWAFPPDGSRRAAALETYDKGLQAARAQKSAARDALLPSWGEPEILMNLAWSNLNSTPPDLDAAEQYAKSALALVPYWHYVRDILTAQIAAARAAAGLHPR